MVINETISGTIAAYDYTLGTWTKNAQNLDDTNVISASITRQCSSDNVPEIGGVYAATLTMTARVTTFSNGFNIRGAKIILSHTINSVSDPLGVFWVTSAKRIGGVGSTIFEIEAVDAVGWLDVSSYNLPMLGNDGKNHLVPAGVLLAFNSNDEMRAIDYTRNYNGTYTTGWLGVLTGRVNQILEETLGIPDMVEWYNWDITTNGSYINCHAWREETSGESPYSLDFMIRYDETTFKLLYGGDKLDSERPRDLYSQFAEFAGGFIYARETGELSLGQYNMIEYPQIDFSEIMEEGAEIADYDMRLDRVRVYIEASDKDTWHTEDHWQSGKEYDNVVYFNWDIVANIPINMKCFAKGIPEGEWLAGWIVQALRYGYGYTDIDGKYHAPPIFRPFVARVFPRAVAEIPRLGQSAKLGTDLYSTVTKITWDLHGGYEISCAGSDSRTLVDTVNISAARKTKNDLQNWLRAIGG